jgi:ABC-2 type transport system ATP-binding protein
MVGFIGPNGAGKTTTLKCLSGLLYPTSGEVLVLGFKPWNREYEYLRQFSIVMGQKNQLWWDLPPIETFELQKDIYEIGDSEYKKSLHMLTDLMDVSDVLNVQVRKLSLGQRMKCELIAALLHSPKVLFLDEPTIGLDVTMQIVIRDFLRAYNAETKSTVILTSHNMDDVKSLCDRIIMINHGQIMFDGKLKQIIDKYAENKIITYTSDQGEIIKLEVPRKQAAAKAAEIITSLSVEDITIEEPPIEAIIRHMFSDFNSKL